MLEQPTPNEIIEARLRGTPVLDLVRQHILNSYLSYERTEIEQMCLQLLRAFIDARPGERSLQDLIKAAHIAYGKQFIAPRTKIRDALGRELDALSTEFSSSMLLLIDPLSDANWAHPCWIVTVEEQGRGEIRSVLNDFPPLQDADQQLVRFV